MGQRLSTTCSDGDRILTPRRILAWASSSKVALTVCNSTHLPCANFSNLSRNFPLGMSPPLAGLCNNNRGSERRVSNLVPASRHWTPDTLKYAPRNILGGTFITVALLRNVQYASWIACEMRMLEFGHRTLQPRSDQPWPMGASTSDMPSAASFKLSTSLESESVVALCPSLSLEVLPEQAMFLIAREPGKVEGPRIMCGQTEVGWNKIFSSTRSPFGVVNPQVGKGFRLFCQSRQPLCQG